MPRRLQAISLLCSARSLPLRGVLVRGINRLRLTYRNQFLSLGLMAASASVESPLKKKLIVIEPEEEVGLYMTTGSTVFFPFGQGPPAKGLCRPLRLRYEGDSAEDDIILSSGYTIFPQIKTHKLVVRKLPVETIYACFSDMCNVYGTVDRVCLVSDKPNMCSMGYGYVTYENYEDAEKAITGLNKDGFEVEWASG